MKKLRVVYAIRIAYLLGAGIETFILFQTPWYQFKNKKTSILTEVLEPEREFYPSVTVCAGHKEGSSNILDLVESLVPDTSSLQSEEMQTLIEQYNYNLSDVIPGLYQEYVDSEPDCSRDWPGSINHVLNSSHWEVTIPHPWMSGKCFTYNPEKFSTPGNCYALRFAIGRNESDQSLLDSIRVFVHPPGEFSFFVEQDFMPNVLRIDLLDLKQDHANIFTLKKTMMTNLDRSERRCDGSTGYNWRTCLDGLFYSYKGCQDPWYANQKLELEVCSNLSYILGHTHNRGPVHISYDKKFDDRPYMAEQELTLLRRKELQCFPPCQQTQFHTQISYKPRDRVKRYEYGEDWIYAVKLIYKNLLQEKKEEYLVCETSCLLSSAGGYIGIFFGISLFDFLFFFEWFSTFIFISLNRKNK